MKNLFDPSAKNEILSRIDKLKPDSKALWGKMNVNHVFIHMTLGFDVSTGNFIVIRQITSHAQKSIKIFSSEC